MNHGCYGNGKGGAGKSWTIEIIVDELTQKKYLVCGAAFTHVAVSNITHCFPNSVNTITHFLLNKIPQIKRAIAEGKKVALVLDEASMIQMHLLPLLGVLKFLGVEFYIFGDFAGQFAPIMLNDPKNKWSTMDSSDFMHDLCNGLKIEFKKYRRGDDFEHFKLVGSIYPQKMNLSEALIKARAAYPIKEIIPSTTLCVSNLFRKKNNASYNEAEYKKSHQVDGAF